MPDRSKVVLVTGATGAVGPRIVQTVHDAGYRIRTLSLDPLQAGIIPDQLEVLTGDITDTAAVQSAVEGADTVIHLAGWGSAIDSGHGFSCYTLGRLAV